MIWPAVDLAGGAVVQLVQGEREALRRALDPTLDWLQGFPQIQVVDLDAAKGEGANPDLVRRCCRAGFRVRVGGGIRSVDRAQATLDAGADSFIVGSAAFTATGYDFDFLDRLQSLGRERIVIALDSLAGHVATHGWRKAAPATALEAARALASYCSGFLYTSIETEGGLAGLPLAPVQALRQATSSRLSVAGGIASLEEVERLLALGCEPVLGMALYTGAIPLPQLRERATRADLEVP